MADEIILGGTMNHVVKIGETVRRKFKGHPALHEYLRYLEKEGMRGVPRFIGIDDRGMEILSYVRGETAESGLGFDHECMRSDEAVCDIARFLRKLHDVSAGFLPEAVRRGWTNPLQPIEICETICHGDAAIWNFAFTDEKISGMFDFDQACPGTRVWDLTIAVFSAVLVSCYDYEPAKHEAETRRRIRLFFDAYGIECPDDIITQTADRIQVWRGEEEARGEMSVHYGNVVAYLRKHANDWV